MWQRSKRVLGSKSLSFVQHRALAPGGGPGPPHHMHVHTHTQFCLLCTTTSTLQLKTNNTNTQTTTKTADPFLAADHMFSPETMSEANSWQSLRSQAQALNQDPCRVV